MLIVILLLLINSSVIQSSHFNGGSITWSPVNPSTNSSPVLITITQSYSWVYPDVKCATNVPLSTGNSLYYTVNLTCVANCPTDGGYSAKPISILTDCTSASSSVGTMTSQRSVNINLTANAHFTIAYRSLAWRKLGNTNAAYPGWSIASLIDLRKRPDGLINTPPVATVASPQYVIVNRTTQIKIPVTDVNEQDDLRCRWAKSTYSATSADECDDTCYPNGLPANTILSDCTLIFTGLSGGIWYAISIQVEDFLNTTSTTPMSSVPVQFLIYVMANLACYQVPVILPLTTCLEVQVGTPVGLTLFVMNYCNRTKTIVTDVIDTISITGLTTSDVSNSTMNASLSYVTLNWTPQINQIGSQQFCAIAYTNEKTQSEEYCITFNVRNQSYFCRPTATLTTSTTSTTETTTSTRTTTSTTKTTTQSATTSTVSTTTTTETTTSTTSSSTSRTTTSTSTTSSTTSRTTTSITSSITSGTTTSTSTSTSTTSSTTSGTTTSITTTVTSVTSSSTTSSITSTVRTTTSMTSITETIRTTTAVSNPVNIPLIVGLSLLALLISLCCCFCWLYHLLWKPLAKRRRRNHISTKPKHEKYYVCEKKVKTKINHSTDTDSSSHISETTLPSINNDQKMNENTKKSAMIQACPQSKQSAIAIHPLNKVLGSFQSKKDQQIEQQTNSPCLTKVVVVKSSKKTTAKSPRYRSNEAIPIDLTDQSITETRNNNTVRRRNSNAFSGVNVTKVKKSKDDTKITTDQVSNNIGKKSSNTRITEVSSKWKRSTVQPHPTKN